MPKRMTATTISIVRVEMPPAAGPPDCGSLMRGFLFVSRALRAHRASAECCGLPYKKRGRARCPPSSLLLLGEEPGFGHQLHVFLLGFRHPVGVFLAGEESLVERAALHELLPLGR